MQVNQIVDKLPRVDIPASWVDVVVEADRPFALEPLFTRDPRQINDLQILIGMMVIRGIYERHQVHSLNHGIGFDTAAIELLLPTYGESLGLRGKICEHWALNPHPTMIPAIESGWVKSIHCFGSEVGMDRYVAARPDMAVIPRRSLPVTWRIQVSVPSSLNVATAVALNGGYEFRKQPEAASMWTKSCGTWLKSGSEPRSQ